MAIKRSAKRVSALKKSRRFRDHLRHESRKLHLEALEARQVMAGGLTLSAVIPNTGVATGNFLDNNEVLNVAPREITFRFAEGQEVDPNSVAAGIRIERAGADGSLADPNVIITPGWVGMGDTSREVIMRFASNLPDDLYRITLVGTGTTPLQDRSVPPLPFNNGQDLQINFELDLGAKVMAVVPQPVTRNVTGGLQQARNVIEVYFDQNEFALASVQNPAYYRLINTATNATSHPTGVTYDGATRKATLTFGADIPLGTFKLEVGTSNEGNDIAAGAVHISNSMAAAQQGTIGDSLTAADQRNDVDLYKFDLRVPAAITVNLTPSATLDGVIRIFDSTGTPVGAPINATPAGGAESVTSGVLAAGSYYIGFSSSNNNAYEIDGSPAGANGTTTGGYSFTVTFNDLPGLNDTNSSFAAATPLGVLGLAGRTLSAAISPQPYNNIFPQLPVTGIQGPGVGDDPGHRDVPYEAHLATVETSPGVRVPAFEVPDRTTGVREFTYDFQSIYGFTPQGQPLFNAINEVQKQRAREVMELYSRYLGVQFREVASGTLADLTIATGDPRAIAPTIPTNVPVAGVRGIEGIADRPLNHDPTIGATLSGRIAIVNANVNWGNSEYGGEYFRTMMHEIGSFLGLGTSYDLPGLTLMGGEEITASNSGEPVFPGDHDIIHGTAVHRAESRDIDLYSFTVAEAGVFRAETIAERMAVASRLNTALTLYKETGFSAVPTRTVIARNDDYYGNDSYIELRLEPGTYYVAITSTGNTEFDPTITDSGFGGRTQGTYDLKMQFTPDGGTSISDTTGIKLDGDADGRAGGKYEFWFQSGTTIFVDKVATSSTTADGAPLYNNISAALAVADAASQAGAGTVNNPIILRIVGNAGADGDLNTTLDNTPYLLGFFDADASTNDPLADGGEFQVPKNVTVMIDAGANFKLHRANFDAGTSTQGVDRSGGAIQILGTPQAAVKFSSNNDATFGGDTNGPSTLTAAAGDYGGIVFRADSDREGLGVYLSYVNHAHMQYGGGRVFVDSVEDSYTPIHMASARPSLSYNTITLSSEAAMSADPNSFDDDGFRPNVAFIDRRIGPDIHDNTVVNNTFNGLFVRTRTLAGTPTDLLDVSARWDDTDIVHVVAENLLISGTPGGSNSPGANRLTTSLADARLQVDPGVIVKLGGARIETRIGSQFIAEGNAELPIVFTSIKDDKYGASGTFDTNRDAGATLPAGGQWGGLVFGPVSSAHLDFVKVFYAGGIVPIEGNTNARFNAIEANQADLRIANSLLQFNAAGGGTGDRAGRWPNADATIFVRGSQPVIVNNIIRDNTGPMLSFNANAMQETVLADYGRATGAVGLFGQYNDNRGPLVRNNRMINNALNGMEIRGGTLTTESIWDDTDIAHILRSEIIVLNHHTFSGLRLQSSPSESLVVKLKGTNAGFTANGVPLDIDDRIGGTLHIVGQPGRPVILTSLADDTVPAGFQPDGLPIFDHNNDGIGTAGGGNNDGDQSGPLPPIPPATAELQVTTTTNATTLANALVLRSLPVGVTITNAAFTGGNTAAGTYINGDQVALGVDQRGIILTNGNANLPISNTTTGFSTSNNLPGDADLQGLVGSQFTILDATTLTLTIQVDPASNVRSGSFDFQFGSDEYKEFVGFGFNDILGAFINGGSSTNVIRDSDGSLVTINNALFSQDNTGDVLDVEYDGLTPGLTATFPLRAGTNVLKFAVGDGADRIVDSGAFISDLRFSSRDVGTGGISEVPGSGDWRGIRLDKLSNDRNVSIQLEREPGYIGNNDQNKTPATAQFLGSLAPNEKSGDDNRRLGFEIDGTIAHDRPGDIDVYSFRADSGSEIWIDIDRTSFALDTMVELTDAAGNIIARATDTNPYAPVVNVPDVELWHDSDGGVRAANATFNKDHFNGRDTFTTNPRDAIIRVTLPHGPGGQKLLDTPYFIRVRSQAGKVIPLIQGATGVVTEIRKGNTGPVVNPVTPAPFQNGENEIQRVLLTGVPTGGTFTLTFNGQTTTPLAYNASATDVLSALGALSTIGGPANVNVAVTGASQWDITFQNSLARADQNPLIVRNNETQRVSLSGTPTAGTFTLAYTSGATTQTTTPLAFNATAAQVQAALETLSLIGAGNVAVTGPAGGPWEVTFQGPLVNSNVNTLTLNADNVNEGRTSGHYQLQLRLRQQDEKPGSTVRFAEIRYANNGIEVLGLPSHSPLTGESVEANDTANNTQGGAQNLGNILASDRNVISVGGALSTSADIDWYRFDLNVDLMQVVQNYTAQNRSWATMFDLDYADGLSRPDTSISVFDELGRLILIGRESDIQDDQPTPGTPGNDAADLTRGTFNKLDPFIGSVQLPAGIVGQPGVQRTYFVAIHSNRTLPQVLDQTFVQGAPTTNLPTRLEPVDSIARIVSEHFDLSGGETAVNPENVYGTIPRSTFIDVTSQRTLQSHVRPFTLADVALYVSTFNGLFNVDPVTGVTEVADFPDPRTGPFSLSDINMRSDATLWGYEGGIPGQNVAGRITSLDHGTGVGTTYGNDEIPDEGGPPPAFDETSTGTVDGVAWGGTQILGDPLFDPLLFYSIRHFTSGTSRLYRANPTNGSAAPAPPLPWGRKGISINLRNGASAITTFALPGSPVTMTVSALVHDDAQLFDVGYHGTTINFTQVAMAPGALPIVTVVPGTPGSAPPPPEEVPGTPGQITVQLNSTVTNATGTTNFGPATVRYTADQAGDLGNNIRIGYAAADLGPASANPLIRVEGDLIHITLNTNATSPTTANSLIAAVNVHPQAGSLVTAALNSGVGAAPIHTPVAGRLALTDGFDATSAQEVVDALNQFAGRNATNPNWRLVHASTSGVEGTVVALNQPIPTMTLLGDNVTPSPFNPIFTTGISFANSPGNPIFVLHGVTNTGQFFRNISLGGGLPSQAINVTVPGLRNTISDPGINFTGITRAPMNVENGFYSDLMFATGTYVIGGANRSVLVALDQEGHAADVFDTDSDGVRDSAFITINVANPTGLAFSNLDFNMWHPTYRREDEPGKNIGPSPTRNSGRANDVDNLAFYFGVEQWQQDPGPTTDSYLTYGAVGGDTPLQASAGQLGVLNARTQRELSQNPNLINNYNMPGGGYGSLVSDEFSLATVTKTDKPTFYFDYYLATQNQNNGPNGQMRDSARVYISANGGATWDLVATNNDNPDNPNTGSALFGFPTIEGEIPTFQSASVAEMPDNPRQQVQLLHDNLPGTDVWRQARIDLSRYAGLANLQMRFDFATAGNFNNDPSVGFENAFGNFNTRGRGMDNQHEGFLIDNIIIGTTERGEMVINAPTNSTNFFATPVPQNYDPTRPVATEVLTGPYQLEIRRGTEYGISDAGIFPSITLLDTLDTNERLIPDERLVSTADLTDDFNNGLFNIKESAKDGLRWTVSNFTAGSGTFSAASPVGVPHGENSSLEISALTGSGVINFAPRVSSQAGGDFLRFYIDGIQVGSWSGDQAYRRVSFPISEGRHNFRWSYEKNLSVTAGFDRAFIDDVFISKPQLGSQNMYDVLALHDPSNPGWPHAPTVPFPTSINAYAVISGNFGYGESIPPGFGRIGDDNVHREQGHIQIEQNLIYKPANTGIIVDAGARASADGSLTSPGGVRNLPTLNNERLVPGVSLVNNVVAEFGQTGILFSGDANPAGQAVAAVPFGRIVNNTIYGGATATGVGISVTENASPTLLNNIIAKTATGINIDATSGSTVIGANLFVDNTANGPIGTDAITPPNGTPVFVDPANRNYYPIDNSPAVDSSINTLGDRPSISAVKQAVGIPDSNILAPERDLFGQRRIDDPSQDPPPGLGNEIFKDRGAVERADFVGPTLALIDPLDNDGAGRDRDPDLTEVLIRNDVLTRFVLKFSDLGTGLDDLSMSPFKFTITRNGTPLVLGTDYTFVFNSNTDEVFFFPVSGQWQQSFTYVITVANTQATNGIRDMAGNFVQANQPNGETKFTIFTGIVRDFGDAPSPYPSGSHDVTLGYFLGAGVSEEQAPLAVDTFDDGITNMFLSPAVNSTITVTASAAGELDAWFDLNRDGDWDDAGEYVLQGRNVVAGSQTVSFVFGTASTAKGLSQGRFRFSSAGISTPTGIAADGEVEDYQINITGPAFQNPGQYANAFLDVDNNQVINAIDVLIVINFINLWTPMVAPAAIPLPPTSPPFPSPAPTLNPAGNGQPGGGRYLDVNGDSILNVLDVIQILNWINANLSGSSEGEGEGEGEGGATAYASAAAPAVPGPSIPDVLFATPSVVIEEREETRTRSSVDELFYAAGNEPSEFELVAIHAASRADDNEHDLSLSRLADRKWGRGSLEGDAWESLLSELAVEAGSRRRRRG